MPCDEMQCGPVGRSVEVLARPELCVVLLAPELVDPLPPPPPPPPRKPGQFTTDTSAPCVAEIMRGDYASLELGQSIVGSPVSLMCVCALGFRSGQSRIGVEGCRAWRTFRNMTSFMLCRVGSATGLSYFPGGGWLALRGRRRTALSAEL